VDAMTEPTPPQPRRILPPIYFAVALGAMVALHFLIPVMMFGSSAFTALGVGLILAGVAIAVWARGLFRRAGTTVKPFQESSALVTAGPYRLTRNPMYVGMVSVLLGAGLWLGSLLPLLVVPIFATWIERRFIRHEEAGLERKFGSAYREYTGRVRRWI
jgi:protein-S-isoprenylcysteine O-methyltransferase Ste14